VLDIGKIERELTWRPSNALDEDITFTYRWRLNHG
jgi:nucleoside-diphosphate-sugar epimerase